MDEFWDSQNIFELKDAAYIWAGLYPAAVHEPRLSPKVKTALDFLEFEIKAGRLEVLHWEYPGARRVHRQGLQRLAEQRDYRPTTLFPDQPPAQAPVGLDGKPLSALERANLQKQIAALAMLLAAKRADLRVGDKPNRKQIAAAVAELLDAVEAGEGGVELDRFGLSSTEFRRNITEGLALLFSK